VFAHRKWRAAHADKEAWIAASLTLLAMTGLRDFDGFLPSLRAQRGNPFVPCMLCMPLKVNSTSRNKYDGWKPILFINRNDSAHS
jgi:hypothetical protein